MLNSFDWIRRCRSGGELIATLRCLKEESNLFSQNEDIGFPHSALNYPCQRCFLFSRLITSDEEDELYCKFCKAIIKETRGLDQLSRRSIVLWGYTNRLPRELEKKDERIIGLYIHDNNRFFLVIYRKELKDWLQELVLYNGSDLRGLIQIFPTIGSGSILSMGEVICRAAHHEANYPMDRLRVRFYTVAYDIIKPHLLDQKGILTFEISEFLNMMSTVMVFRALLNPDEQKVLYELLTMKETPEQKFHWGRFYGMLSQEARDMLTAWRIQNWSKDQIKLLYKLIDYVKLYRLH